eukprot:GAFH01003613.1.p5 GENE.GAFH01003613.1~~GAFH01003613.1.p5  ORF type:complete len:54 (+),score=3.58 GAFH01003613.1:305-466(+)
MLEMVQRGEEGEQGPRRVGGDGEFAELGARLQESIVNPTVRMQIESKFDQFRT